MQTKVVFCSPHDINFFCCILLFVLDVTLLFLYKEIKLNHVVYFVDKSFVFFYCDLDV